MLIKTADGWKPLMGPIPSEARVGWFVQAAKDGYKYEQSYRDSKEEARKLESWTRNCFLRLHQRTFPAGMHYPGSECMQYSEPQGCPFDWDMNYLAGL